MTALTLTLSEQLGPIFYLFFVKQINMHFLTHVADCSQ